MGQEAPKRSWMLKSGQTFSNSTHLTVQVRYNRPALGPAKFPPLFEFNPCSDKRWPEPVLYIPLTAKARPSCKAPQIMAVQCFSPSAFAPPLHLSPNPRVPVPKSANLAIIGNNRKIRSLTIAKVSAEPDLVVRDDPNISGDSKGQFFFRSLSFKVVVIWALFLSSWENLKDVNEWFEDLDVGKSNFVWIINCKVVWRSWFVEGFFLKSSYGFQDYVFCRVACFKA